MQRLYFAFGFLFAMLVVVAVICAEALARIHAAPNANFNACFSNIAPYRVSACLCMCAAQGPRMPYI
eukprot:6012257-Pleurochrysis_carterae.AAC.1